MSLRFLLGAAGSGKTRACLDEICHELAGDPLGGRPLYFLVPEQATFQMERALLLHRSDVSASARARVVSFQRLAYLALQEEGGSGRPQLTEVGKLLALEAVISRKRRELLLFGDIAHTEGFLEQLAATFFEMRAYRQTPRGLMGVRDLLQGEGLIAHKLHDIALLYEAYDAFVQEHFHDPQTALDLAAGAIVRARLFRGADVWIDGFAGFTPQEYAILEALLTVARRVSVALCLDPEALGDDDIDAWVEGPRDDLFHPTRESLIRLRDLARSAGVPVEPPVLLTAQPAPRFAAAPLLGRLERWLAGGMRRRPGAAAVEGGSAASNALGATARPAIEVIEAPDLSGEVEAAAREILRAVRDGARYSEIAVITRDLEAYKELIETTFARWGIPYFLDHKEKAYHHPLVTLIRAALEIASYGFDTDRVFRYLKTDLVPVPRAEVDLLENEALALGIEGEVWRDEAWWRQGPAKGAQGRSRAPWQQVRDIRERGLGPLFAFVDAVGAAAGSGAGMAGRGSEGRGTAARTTVGRYVALLWDLLETNRVGETISAWVEQARAEDLPLVADEHLQVHQGVVRLLEQLILVLGDVEATPDEFAEIVEAGLERLRIGRVPPRIDQVVVGSVERSRQPDLSVAIVIGANDGRFPKIPGEDALFLDEERALLESVGLRLGPDSQTKLMHEQYLVYIALTRASRRLVVTYSRADEDGRPLRPSSFVARMLGSFPGVVKTVLPAAGTPAQRPEYAGGLLPWLARRLARFKEGIGTSPAERAQLMTIYNWLVERTGYGSYVPESRGPSGHQSRPELRPESHAAIPAADPLAALAYQNRSVPLTRDLVDALYGDPMTLSPSGLEAFGACAFSFFAGHGLKLEERVPFRLDAALLGQVGHAVLSRFVQRLIRDGVDWGALSREEADGWVEELFAERVERLIGDTGKLSRADHFTLERLKRGLQAVVWALGEHARRGRFRPVAVELSFGPQGPLPPLVIEAEGRQATVRGRIDRVDLVEAQGVRYARVVDYKSGVRRFRLHRLVYGLDLQLALYLSVLAANADGALGGVPAGCLYQPVYDPLVSAEGPPEPGDDPWRKMLRADGLILDDGVVPRLMDAEAGGRSELVPLYFRKDGELGSNSSTADPEAMDALLGYALGLVARFASAIARGETGIAPYELSEKTPCKTCAFRPVCQFDPTVGQSYRRLEPLRNEQAWEIIRSGGERRDERAGRAG